VSGSQTVSSRSLHRPGGSPGFHARYPRHVAWGVRLSRSGRPLPPLRELRADAQVSTRPRILRSEDPGVAVVYLAASAHRPRPFLRFRIRAREAMVSARDQRRSASRPAPFR
jgi:hypothetical protein